MCSYKGMNTIYNLMACISRDYFGMYYKTSPNWKMPSKSFCQIFMRFSRTIQLALTFLFLYRARLLLSSISKKIYPYEVFKEEVSSRRELCIRGIHHNCWYGSQVTKKAPQLSKYMNEIIISTHQNPRSIFTSRLLKMLQAP